MTYVLSDLHGEYQKYRAMLEKIRFSQEDTLYVLGDVIDRGAEPIRILQDMMYRSNVFPLLGNHEYIAIHVLRKLMVEITEENYATHLNAELLHLLMDWQKDGGDVTLKQFRALPMAEREALLAYLEEFTYYEWVEVGDRRFLLVHAGLGNFSRDKAMEDYTPQELLCFRGDETMPPLQDVYLITGHTPTQLLHGRAEILRCGRHYCIDCGATFARGRLACLCLDTMEAFYVSDEDCKEI